VPLLEDIARAKAVPHKAIRFEKAEEAQSAPAPSTSFCLFYKSVAIFPVEGTFSVLFHLIW